MSRPLFANLILLCSMAAGCATHADRLAVIRDSYHQGNLTASLTQIDTQLEKRDRDADVLKLDRAMVELTSGKPRDAERLLRETRDRFDHLEQSDVREKLLSQLTDDQRLAYAGEPYEQVLIRVFLTLSNLLGDGGDAHAYALQINEKQRAIIADRKQLEDTKEEEQEAPTERLIALGPYVRAAMGEASFRDHDLARNEIQQVVSWQPDFQAGKDDLQRIATGRHSAPGNGVVYLFTLVGKGPYKVESVEVPSSAALLIADRILSATANQTLPPTIAGIKVPRVVRSSNRIHAVRVLHGNESLGETETITDVGRLAVEQSEADFDRTVARAVVRRVIKKGAIYAIKDHVNTQKGGLAALAFDVAGVAWEATESADTRCWGLLPDQIQVLRIELPAGTQRLTLGAVDRRGPIGPAVDVDVPVHDGHNTYLLAGFPVDRLVGRVSISGTDRAR